MSNNNKELVLEVLDIAVNIGVPAVTDFIEALQKDEVSLEDIEGLKKRIKANPEEYFS